MRIVMKIMACQSSLCNKAVIMKEEQSIHYKESELCKMLHWHLKHWSMWELIVKQSQKSLNFLPDYLEYAC